MVAQRDKNDPVLTEYVRERLVRLLDESAPRRASPDRRAPALVPLASRVEAAPEFLPSDDEDPLDRGERRGSVPDRGHGSRRLREDSGGGDLDVIDDWSDPSRLRPFRRSHLGVVAVLLVLGLLVAGWSALRARPVAIASTPATSAATSSTSSSAAGPTASLRSPGGVSATPEAQILVHVLGAVRKPGVVTLPDRSRVRDAVLAAGGLRGDATPGELNLAQVLTDGQQILIGRDGKTSSGVSDGSSTGPGNSGSGRSTSGSASASSAVIDLNTASLAQLEELPGVGPVTAEKILAWREEHTRFSRVEELQEVDGIGPKTYAEIAPHARV